MEKYDVGIIGSGPGGYVAAIYAAKKGLSVAIIEKDKIGGTCLNKGCIPTKVYAKSAAVFKLMKKCQTFGMYCDNLRFEWSEILKRKSEIVEKLVKGVEFLLQKNKIKIFRGSGEIISENKVKVNDDIIECDNIIIATGSESFIPQFFGQRSNKIITSDELLEIEELPKSLIIVGGGVIGCEFASILNSFGVQVTIVELLDRILFPEDKEVSRRLKMLLTKQGIKIFTKKEVTEISENNDFVSVTIKGGKTLEAEKCLISVGRKLNVNNFCGDDVKFELSNNGIKVDKFLRTNIKNIYAIGDVINKSLLAHSASAQGMQAIDHILGGNRILDYNLIPNCIFTFPEIGSIGLNSQTAKEKGIEIKENKFNFRGLGKSLINDEIDGFVKVISDKTSNKILGVHIIGYNASDLISEAIPIINSNLSIDDIIHNIHPHPTLSEAFMEAIEGLNNMSIHSV